MYTTNEIETEKIIKIVDKISNEGGKLAMTTAMKLREEGIKEGIREGKIETAKKMVNKGYSIEEICEITGLEREDVEKLKKDE